MTKGSEEQPCLRISTARCFLPLELAGLVSFTKGGASWWGSKNHALYLCLPLLFPGQRAGSQDLGPCVLWVSLLCPREGDPGTRRGPMHSRYPSWESSGQETQVHVVSDGQSRPPRIMARLHPGAPCQRLGCVLANFISSTL